jgi:hypothetical protein
MKRRDSHNEVETVRGKRFRQKVTLDERNVCMAAVGDSCLSKASWISIDADDFL